MSGALRAVGKVFKKVVKVAKVVLPIALAAAAVVFTGGAALGLAPFAGGFAGAVGGVVSSLGISGTLAGALTGSIVSSGFGAAAGLVTGGVKGAQKGALIGAATGGVLGAASPAMFGVGTGATDSAINQVVGQGDKIIAAGGAQGALPDVSGSIVNGAAKGLGSIPGVTDVGSAIKSGLASTAAGVAPASAQVAAASAPVAAAPVAAAPAAAPATGGTGLLSGLLNNPNAMVMGGNLLTGLFTPSAAQEARDNGNRLFGDDYSGGTGFGTPANYGTPHVGIAQARQFRLNPQTLQVEEIPAR